MDKVRLSSAYGEMKKKDEVIKDQIEVLKRLLFCLAVAGNIKLEESVDYNEGFHQGVNSVMSAIVDIIQELERRSEDGIEQA